MFTVDIQLICKREMNFIFHGIKAVLDLCSGNSQGASESISSLVQTAPLLTEVTFVVVLVIGEQETVEVLQQATLRGLGNIANGIPGVGHLKGTIHYACDDKEVGDAAMKSANH